MMTVEYQMHLTDYIAKCINKNKPQLQCNGQCVFMEKIKQNEQKESKKDLISDVSSSLYFHNEYFIINMFLPNKVLSENHFLPYSIDYRYDYHTSVFRPPVSYSILIEVA